ncbi:MAG: hypothetical protein HW418_2735, partial [Anaerolineales bacterium]|nr:hypothetical protein [Anaerolineales bacterium]
MGRMAQGKDTAPGEGEQLIG